MPSDRSPPSDDLASLRARLERLAASYVEFEHRTRARDHAFSAEEVALVYAAVAAEVLACLEGADVGAPRRKGSRRRYSVEYTQDKTGVWTAVIDRAQGASCVTQGPTKDEARRRIREALALYLDDEDAAAEAELVEEDELR